MTTRVFSLDRMLIVLLFAAGMYLTALSVMGPGLEKVIGDMADSRLNNYFLENGHAFITGKTDNYWTAPFMYPETDVITYSDNLLGTLPLYSFFRIVGCDVETAYQLWILVLFTLNFFAALFVFRKFSGSPAIAAIGAYIFAFGLPLAAGQIYHAQVFPRFMVPLVLYWLLRFFKTQDLRYAAFTFFGIAYQFYCGLYLGFLLSLAVMIVFLVKAAQFKKFKLWLKSFSGKKTIMFFVLIALSLFSLVPLLYPYYQRMLISGSPSYETVKEYIPHPASYFFTWKGTLFWNFLTATDKTIPNWYNHLLFPGGIAMFCFLLFPYLLYKKSEKLPGESKTIFISLSLLILVTLQFYGYSLYRIVYVIPGFSSVRSVGRVINIELFYFAAIVVVSLTLLEGSKYFRQILVFISILCIADHYLSPPVIGAYSKAVSRERIEAIKDKLIAADYRKYSAFAFVPKDKTGSSDYIQLDAMFAAQELNFPTVNGYTATAPCNFASFWTEHDPYALHIWLSRNHLDVRRNKILLIY
jgi:hypothetical protein